MKHETFDTHESYKNELAGSKLLGGFIILMGGIFFLGMSGVSILGYSPWMLMALLPVYWIVMMAYKYYKEDGRVSRRVFSILAFGLLPFAYIAATILGFNVAAIWPIGLIAVGASIILFGGSK